MRLRHPLLPGEPASPLVRVAAAADFGNGVAAVLPFDEYLFINADLTISLNRRPEGEWIGLDSRTLLHPDGIGWAESVLHDGAARSDWRRRRWSCRRAEGPSRSDRVGCGRPTGCRAALTPDAARR